MKINHCRHLLPASLLVAALTSSLATAGQEMMTTAPAPVASAPVDDVISGVLKLDFNTHFISYGSDVWGDGSSMSDPTFNPAVELYFALPAGFTFTLGTWWDVNSKIDSSIGGRIQEIDVYGGLSYTWDKLTLGVTYQAWMYGSDTEDILDFKIAYDTFLAPSLTVHHRLDEGAANGDDGTVLVLGLSHAFELGPVTLSVPLNVAYFVDEDFHNDPFFGGADDGFGYASLGLAASLSLTPYIGDAYGDWSLNGSLTYYVTDDGVIPNNPKDDFLTAGLGVAVAF